MAAANILMFFVTPARSLERSSPWSSLSLHSFMTSTPWKLWQIQLCEAYIHRKHCPVSPMSLPAVSRWIDRNTQRWFSSSDELFQLQRWRPLKQTSTLNWINLNIGFWWCCSLIQNSGHPCQRWCSRSSNASSAPPATGGWVATAASHNEATILIGDASASILLLPSCWNCHRNLRRAALVMPLYKRKGFIRQSGCSNSVATNKSVNLGKVKIEWVF